MKQFISKAGVLLTELPSLIFVRFIPSMTNQVSIGSTTLNQRVIHFPNHTVNVSFGEQGYS